MTDRDFRNLFEEAALAGAKAAASAVPTPMVVTQRTNPLDDASPVKQAWFVADGVCGFAWVHIKAWKGATSGDPTLTRRFSNWLKRNGYVRGRAYEGGVSYHGDFGLTGTAVQSLTRNEAGARAFAEVLRKAGIMANARSRID